MTRRPEHCLPDETTLNAARMIEQLAGWRCELRCEAVPPSLPALGIEPSAELLLLPAAGALWPSQVDAFVATSKCDALIVQIGRPDRAPEVVGTCVQWHRSGVRWHHASPFWLSETSQVWLLASDVAGFHLAPSPLRLGCAPWTSDAQRKAGIRRAKQSLQSEIAR